MTIQDFHIDEITAAPGWSVEHIKTTPNAIFQKREFIQTAHLHIGKHTRSAGLMSCLAVLDSTPRGLRKRPAAVTKRCAVHYIRGHFDEPVTLQQLCQVTGVSDRALESAFKETFDITPKAYITLTRLHGVRRTLCKAGPDDLSVTEVAMRWGFIHLGRFAQYYREQFGESPSESLHRRTRRDRLISIPFPT